MPEPTPEAIAHAIIAHAIARAQDDDVSMAAGADLIAAALRAERERAAADRQRLVREFIDAACRVVQDVVGGGPYVLDRHVWIGQQIARALRQRIQPAVIEESSVRPLQQERDLALTILEQVRDERNTYQQLVDQARDDLRQVQAERDRYRQGIERALAQAEFGLGRVVRELRAALMEEPSG